jgi:hypothetical protein
MTAPHAAPILTTTGQLFISRGVLLHVALTGWVMSLLADLTVPGMDEGPPWRLAAAGIDLLGLLLAVKASDPVTARARLPHLRVAWFATSLLSRMCVAAATNSESGFTALAINSLLAATVIFLLAMRWNLTGFLYMAGVNAALSAGIYAMTPAPAAGAAFLIWFLTLLPGAIGTASVLIRRHAVKRSAVQAVSIHLDALTTDVISEASQAEARLAHTELQIRALLDEVAGARSLPLDPALAQAARELAAELRSQLLMGYSTDWLAEALAFAGISSEVAVIHRTDGVDRIPETIRPSVLAITMLLVAGSRPGLGGLCRGSRPPRSKRVHFFAEFTKEQTAHLTWRGAGYRKYELSPALWSELEYLGTPLFRNDHAGISLAVTIPAGPSC